ncbi:MAG: hypothetical protein WB392_04835 [Methanotrichaceae archaeon]
MPKRLKDLDPSQLGRLLGVPEDRRIMGDEIIRLHLFNRKKMNWYLAAYSPVSRTFFGYFENPMDTMTSGFYALEDILSYGKKGEEWEPHVDDSWKPVPAKDILKLQGYIEYVKHGIDDFT